jgi:hypothetical protein
VTAARRPVLDPAALPEAARLALGLGRRVTRARPRELEHEEQCRLIEWARDNEARYPELALLFAIPNGGHRNKAAAGKLKAAGVRAGVPDLCLPVSRRGMHGLWIELKRPAGGRVSGEQEAWLTRLAVAGHVVAVCYGWEEARDVILSYLNARDVT